MRLKGFGIVRFFVVGVCFNSKVVRLKAMERMAFDWSGLSFNSKVVRLKVIGAKDGAV